VWANLGRLHLLWMVVSGRLLAARGAVFPGLGDCGLSARAARRAWTALGQGGWTSARLLGDWAALVRAEGRWQAHAHGGYRPVAVDVTGFWRPRLRDCPTAHYHPEADQALPVSPVGLVARVRSVATRPLENVRDCHLASGMIVARDQADPAEPARFQIASLSVSVTSTARISRRPSLWIAEVTSTPWLTTRPSSRTWRR